MGVSLFLHYSSHFNIPGKTGEEGQTGAGLDEADDIDVIAEAIQAEYRVSETGVGEVKRMTSELLGV